jgi:hypothetical protein
MPNTVVTRYYPTLDTVIDTDEIPEVLGFLKTGIEGLLGSTHFKDLQYSKSVYGDKAFYSLKIVSKTRLELEIPGTGIFLVLNPDTDDTAISSFPITIQYEWPILAYIRSFNLDGFSFSPEDFFHLALQVLKISEEQVIANAINIFAEPQNEATTSIQQFINNVNAQYQLDIAEPENTDNPIPELTAALQNALQSDVAAGIVVFTTYMGNLSDLDELKTKVNRFFKSLLPTDDLETYIKDLIIPKFATSLQLSAGIEFPRSMLQPVDDGLNIIPPTSDDDDSPRAGFSFAEALFYASTERGFGYEMDIALSSTRPAMIGNTGLILYIQRLKVDLSDTQNIPEADADGRPASFKGVYAQEVSIVLPKKWFDGGDNHPGTTAKLGGYNMLIGSGGISGTIVLEAIQIAPETITDYYEDCFSFQYPIDVVSNNIETTINSYSELLNYLNDLNGTAYQFLFPLTTVLPDGTINQDMDAGNFANLLSTCNSNGVPPRLVKKLGGDGFEIWFTSFDITFQQGQIVESNIQGGLKIPKLKDANGDIANIDIFGHLDDDGGFNVTASEQDGFQPIIIPQVLDIYVNSLELGRDSSDDPFYIGTACDIVFTNEIIKKFIGDQPIKIERLRIYSDGSFEIVGGAISVPTNFTLKIGGTADNPLIEMSITGIHFGSFQEEHNGVMRRYNYFGFDGGINLGLIGVEGRGKGVKYFYTVDDDISEGKEHHSYITIDTIEVDITIPGDATPETATAIIKGWLSISETEYAGGVTFKIPKFRMAEGGAHMRLQPKHPAFIIDANMEIGIPIPLGATGLEITGFRGIAGFRYVAEKEAIGLHSHDDKWYDYYTYPERGVNLKKFHGPDKTDSYTNPVTLGAGVTIATMGSNDVISLRVMALLSIPNMLFIDGRGSILSEEWGLDDTGEPPFFAFMGIFENGVEIGAGLDFKLPQNNGRIIDLHVYMQAGYFWDNPSGWYLNLGTREDPITAKVLTLVEMESFLMFSASGIEAGAKISFDINERFGPIRVKAWFLAEVGGFISFERPQIGGYMTVDAGARVDIFRAITVRVSFFVHFSVEAAKPFLIYAEIRVCGRIKIGFIKLRVCATVKLKWEKDRTINTTPISPITEALRAQAVKGVNMLTGETFELIDFGSSAPATSSSLFDNAILPLDTYVDIKFDKAVLPSEVAGDRGIGSYNNPPENYEDLIPPINVLKGNELRQVTHRYQITNIKIMAAKEQGGSWAEYHPFEAVVDTVDRDTVNHLRIGHWQKSSKEYNAIRILATSPFSYTEQGEPGWFIPEQLGLTNSTFFCSGEARRPKCVNWINTPLNTEYYTVNHYPYYHSYQQAFFNITQGQSSNVNGIEMSSVATVVNQPNTFDFDQSLEFPNTSTIYFKLPQSSTEVNIKMSTNAQSVKVVYYKSFLPEGGYLMEYTEIESITYSQSQLANQNGITYTNIDDPISKIDIIPVLGAAQAQIDNIYEQIEQLFNDTYEQIGINLPEGVTVEIPLDTETYFDLLNQLEELQNQSCSVILEDCVKDERLCSVYDILFDLFKTKYPAQIESIEEINNYIGSYNEFVEIIFNELEPEFINTNLQPTFDEYRSLLLDISENLNNNDFIERYYQMRDKAENIINILNVLGNCDCSQNSVQCNDIDEVLCSFYEALNTIFTDCIQPAETISEVQSNLDCVNDIINSIKTFDTDYEHPLTSNDIEVYLAQNYDHMNNAHEDLVDYFAGNSELTEEEALNLYNNIVVTYTQVVVNLISQLGNCNCENQHDEPQLRCNTMIHSICWLSVQDYTYNLNIPGQEAIQEDYEAMLAGINNVVDPIWRPDTKYYIEFEVKDIVNETDDNDPFKYYYGFRTAGTIGHYHNAPNVDYGNEYHPQTGELLNRDIDGKLTNPNQYALTSLEQYIDYRRSYPNADGNLLQSKPLFYSEDEAKLLLFYIKPYVAHMLKDQWDLYGNLSNISNQDGIQALKVFIQDPVTNVLMEHPMPPEVGVENIPQTTEEWNDDTEPPMPFMLQYIQNFVEAQGGDCSFVVGDVIQPASQYSTIKLHNLKPRKMYTAIFTNTFKDVTKQIHNYVFQTSRYLNFIDQINSYVLEADENQIPITQALFNLNLDLNNQKIDDAYTILTTENATNDTLESQFIDYLDRLLVGTLRMVPLDPPTTTEFNVIRNQNTDEAIALWIRNPEPFNDPKIPLEFIKGVENSQVLEEQGAIAIMLNETQRDLAYTVLYSKDYSQALIMHSSKKLTADSLNIRFQYKLWNGYEYSIEDAILVNLLINPEN